MKGELTRGLAVFVTAWVGGPTAATATAQSSAISPAEIDRRVALLESSVIAWRRDFHQHPELSNQEVRTAGIVTEHYLTE